MPFTNPHNVCYLNSVVNALGWLIKTHPAGIIGWKIVGAMMQAVVVESVTYLPLMLHRHGLLLGWLEWARQHDAAEFLGHLLSKMPEECTMMLGEWGAIDAESGAEHYSHPLRQCIPISLPQGTVHTLQSLVRAWSEQTPRPALYSPSPDLLCLQLMRFEVREAIVHKNTTTITCNSLTDPLAFPVHMIGDRIVLETVWYAVAAVVVHHGLRPDHGHYTTLLRDWEGDGWWRKDDARCDRISAVTQETLSNIYLIFLRKILAPPNLEWAW